MTYSLLVIAGSIWESYIYIIPGFSSIMHKYGGYHFAKIMSNF